MNKNKMIIIVGFVGIAIMVIVSFLLARGDSYSGTIITSNNSINVSMKAVYNANKIPPGFEIKENTDIAKQLGITNNKKLQATDSIHVSQNLIKDGDLFRGAEGTIELTIGESSHKLAIQSSQVSHHVLNNGQNLLTGSFEAEMKDANGNVTSTTVSFTSIVETEEQALYVTIGSIVLPYGDDSFATPEIQDFVWSLANFE